MRSKRRRSPGATGASNRLDNGLRRRKPTRLGRGGFGGDYARNNASEAIRIGTLVAHWTSSKCEVCAQESRNYICIASGPPVNSRVVKHLTLDGEVQTH